MSRHAEPVPVPPIRKKTAPAATRPKPRPPSHPQRTAMAQPIQRRQAPAAESAEPAADAPSHAGLPKGLKAGVERLSGLAMDDVRVHRDSAAPAKLGALAFTKGGDIHLGPGQERHLPHEAWHVVQQKQGRVRPTLQMKGLAINDDRGLEREADLMGGRAMDANVRRGVGGEPVRPLRQVSVLASGESAPVQRIITPGYRDNWLHYYFGTPAQEPFKRRDSGYVWTEITKFLAGTQPQGPKPSVAEIAAYYGVEAEEPAAEAPALGELPNALNFHFDSGHGDLHFIAHPTANKSAWSISKQAARTRMENEMTLRMADIIQAAAARYPRPLAWILVADAPGKIGSTVGTADVRRFQIQLQASLGEGAGITYHGFPDDQAAHTGLGAGRNSLT